MVLIVHLYFYIYDSTTRYYSTLHSYSSPRDSYKLLRFQMLCQFISHSDIDNDDLLNNVLFNTEVKGCVYNVTVSF